MKELGYVTEQETKQLQVILNRKNALIELMSSLSTDTPMYEKIVQDLVNTNNKMRDWWIVTAEAHGWEFASNDIWNANTETGLIMLTTSK